MGDIADMLLDGTLCECCGSYIEGDGDGIPRYCSPQCARDRGVSVVDMTDKGPEKTACPECGKRVKLAGLFQHRRDVHGHKKSAKTTSA